MSRQEDALRDLAERLAECNGAVRLVSTVMAMAAAAAAELCETAEQDEPPAPTTAPDRPTAVRVRYLARSEPGSSMVVPVGGGDAVAFTETPDTAKRIAYALDLLAAIEEQEAGNAAAQG